MFNYVPDGAKDKKFEEQLVSLLVKLGANKTVAEEDVKDIIELSTKIRKVMYEKLAIPDYLSVIVLHYS